jgi:predicted ATPase
LLSPDPNQHPSKKFDRWQRMVRLALPGLDHIEAVVREDDKHAYLRLYFRNAATVPASGLSDGSLSILAWTILPFLAATPALLTCEQPEDGVHPKGIEVVVESLRSIRGSQVFVSTHSPLVLAQCQPSQVICMSLADNGAAIATRGDEHPALQDWKESLDLGTLFASGVLG